MRLVVLVTLASCGRSKTPPVVAVADPPAPEGPTALQDTGMTDPQEAVTAAVARYEGRLAYCYERNLKLAPDLQGTVEVAWTVVDGVMVEPPVIVSDDTGYEALSACVVSQVARWRFPAGVSGPMRWPFAFRRG